MHGAVCITSEAAHLASREGHICQATKTIVPGNQKAEPINRNMIVLWLELGISTFCHGFACSAFLSSQIHPPTTHISLLRAHSSQDLMPPTDI